MSTCEAVDIFKSSPDWLEYMYGTIAGWVTRATIQSTYKQWHFSAQDLVGQQYDGIENVYVSMNSFYKTFRRLQYVKRLNALYIDIDCYKEGITKEQALAAVEKEIDKTIPRPTFIIDSGRGLYLIWKIDEDVNALPRWKRVMKYLFKLTKPIGADPSGVEPCRILRVPFSVNSSSGTQVKILDFYDHTYTLYEIIQKYDIKEYETTSKEAKKKAKKETKLEVSKKYGKGSKEKNEEGGSDAKVKVGVSDVGRRIMLGRIKDLETLFSMRKGEDCFRENALFLIRHWYGLLTGNMEEALRKTLEFNAMLDKPHDEKYVISHTASAEKMIQSGKEYRFTNERLLEFLGITWAEEEELTYIKGKLSRKLREKEKNRKKYLRRLEKKGQMTKAEEQRIRRNAVGNLILEGKTPAQICTMLKISSSTYSRDKAIIEAEAAAIVEAAEAAMEAIAAAETVETVAVGEVLENTEKTEKTTLEATLNSEPNSEKKCDPETKKPCGETCGNSVEKEKVFDPPIFTPLYYKKRAKPRVKSPRLSPRLPNLFARILAPILFLRKKIKRERSLE